MADERWSEVDSQVVQSGDMWCCTLCDYATPERRDVRIHIYGKHGEFQAVPCPFCGNTYKNRNSIKAHKIYCRMNPKGKPKPQSTLKRAKKGARQESSEGLRAYANHPRPILPKRVKEEDLSD